MFPQPSRWPWCMIQFEKLYSRVELFNMVATSHLLQCNLILIKENQNFTYCVVLVTLQGLSRHNDCYSGLNRCGTSASSKKVLLDSIALGRVSNQWPMGRMQPEAMNAAQHKIVNLLKTLGDCFVCDYVLQCTICVTKTTLLSLWPRNTKRLDTPA